MTEQDQKQLGKTLWNIADQLRGSMNADDFRDYMLSFLFLRYLSSNYEAAAKKELGADYPDPNAIGNGGKTPLFVWYKNNPRDVAAFEKQMQRKVHYVVKPQYLWGNIVHLAKTQDEKLLDTLQKGFKHIEEEAFSTNYQGLFSEINLGSDKLGGDGDVLGRHRHVGGCLRVFDRAICRGIGEESGGVLYAATDIEHPLRHRHAR